MILYMIKMLINIIYKWGVIMSKKTVIGTVCEGLVSGICLSDFGMNGFIAYCIGI